MARPESPTPAGSAIDRSPPCRDWMNSMTPVTKPTGTPASQNQPTALALLGTRADRSGSSARSVERRTVGSFIEASAGAQKSQAKISAR